MTRKKQVCALNISGGADGCSVSEGTNERLIRAFTALQDIAFLGNYRQDPLFAKSVEAWIIWREILELELQDIDEQIERISAAGRELSD
jgi:hypothetical protein